VITSEIRENKSLLSVSKPPTSSSLVTSTGSSSTLSVPPKLTSDRYLMPTAEMYPSKATMSRRTSSDTQSQSDTSASASGRASGIANGYAGGKIRLEESKPKAEERGHAAAPATDDFDVQSVINERRPPKLKTTQGGTAVASTTTSIASDQYSALIRGEGYSHIYVTTDDRSDDVPSPCGNASESTGTGSLSVIGSISAGGSISSGSGSRNSGSGGVHIGEGGAIGTDVRIYVDDTDSASSSNGHRRRLRDEETLDASTTISSTTTMRNGCGGSGGGSTNGNGGMDESKETPERPSSAGGPLDPS